MPSSSISIHALLAESDQKRHCKKSRKSNFYPRSPCGERQKVPQILGLASGISIHALLAESDHYGWSWYDDFTISIHALLAESDVTASKAAKASTLFLSTLSLRRATVGDVWACRWPDISIHALLAESDRSHELASHSRRYFYPRSPCGERLGLPATSLAHREFLSTLSLRRATDDLGARLANY